MTNIIRYNKSNPNSNPNEREPSEYDGYWLNIGFTHRVTDEEGGSEETFIRLPRGIAVADLTEKPVYAGMSPEFAAQVEATNAFVKAIKTACKNLEEGQAVPMNAEIQLYRRNEAVETTSDNTIEDKITKALFG